MSKTTIGPQALLYPMPVLLVGSNVDGKPNFFTVAWGGIASGEPPMISVAVRHVRHTLKGIRQNSVFSVNIPSAEQVKETDYCGIISGAKGDKVKTCGFKVFYGKLESAPLIEQCPVNLECKVEHMLNLGSHVLVIGRIEEVHISDNCLTDGQPDAVKINSMIYVPASSRSYNTIGGIVAKAFNIGNELK